MELVGSLDGLYFDQDRVIITSGRRADLRRPGEIVISEQTARRFGLRIGQSLTVNLYSGRQASDPGFNPMTRQPVHRVRLTITGIGVFTDEVVQDDPLGIATGRFLWARFTSELYVVPQPAISMVTVAVVTISALVPAILTAIVPGWRAARMPVATVLRAE